jgi:hypothetical protein
MIHRAQNFDLVEEPFDVFDMGQMDLVKDLNCSLGARNYGFHLPYLSKSTNTQQFSNLVEVIEISLVFSDEVRLPDGYVRQGFNDLLVSCLFLLLLGDVGDLRFL